MDNINVGSYFNANELALFPPGINQERCQGVIRRTFFVKLFSLSIIHFLQCQ
jgi:hypothetical protein